MDSQTTHVRIATRGSYGVAGAGRLRGMDARVGLVGLGIMGGGMAHNILRAGLPLTVYNRTRVRAELFAAEGATVADSPAQVAAASDIVVVCVSDTPDVEEVVLGPG